MKLKVILPKSYRVIRDKGLGADGAVQMFHTQNVLRRIKRYMPFLTGATYKLTVLQTNIREPYIVTDVPYGKYLYYGKAMVNAKTGKGPALIPGVGFRHRKGTVLKPTQRPLEYNRTKNPMAGPFWDRTLVACEGGVLVDELQRFINRRSGNV
jgi:hypothetical protein